MEEEEKLAKMEAERQFSIKNKIKFVRARHILHEEEAVIKEIHEKLSEEFGNKPNEDEFAKYAAEISQCPSNVKGGLLGYFGKG